MMNVNAFTGVLQLFTEKSNYLHHRNGSQDETKVRYSAELKGFMNGEKSFSKLIVRSDRHLWTQALQHLNTGKTQTARSIREGTEETQPMIFADNECWICLKLKLTKKWTKLLNLQCLEKFGRSKSFCFPFIVNVKRNSKEYDTLIQKITGRSSTHHASKMWKTRPCSSFGQRRREHPVGKTHESRFPTPCPNDDEVKSANIVLIPLYPAAADQLHNSVGYSPDHHDNKPCAQVDLDVDSVERTSDESIGNNKPTALLCMSLRNASTNSSCVLSTGEDLGRWYITFVPKVHQNKIVEFFLIARLTGHTPQALLGQTLDSFIHPSDSRRLSQWLSVEALNEKNESEKETDTLECRWLCANCTYTWLSISRVCSSQVLDQRTAPSTPNNLHFYRLTWLSGPTDLEDFFEPISRFPFAVRPGSLSASSDAMDNWCREMRFRSGNNHDLVSSTKPEKSEYSLAKKRGSKNILDKKRRYHTTRSNRVPGISNSPPYTTKSQGDKIWNSEKRKRRQSRKWPGKFKSSKAVCLSCTEFSTNISSEVQAVSATCIPLSLSQHMNEMEHYEAVSILPLTTENLIRHTRIHDWVYRYQVMNEQLVGASQTYINEQFVQPRSEEPPVKVTRRSSEPLHQAKKVELTRIPPIQVGPESLNNFFSVPPKENINSWNPTTQKAYLETEYQRQILTAPQFTQDLHAYRLQEECNNHSRYFPQHLMVPNFNGKLVLPLEVYETTFLAHPNSNILPELITNAPPYPTTQPKQHYPSTTEGLLKQTHRFAKFEHSQPVGSKVLRPPSSHDESAEEQTNDLTLLMQCKDNQRSRSSTVAATTSSASRDDISKSTADYSKRNTFKNCREAARAQNPQFIAGKNLMKV
ncbi:hypothetical protein CRM22_009445 [Opisthorchis felineus]|uniref:PAS domain-containing protein n=1 Tax=Opisthorchis felineus TaxID=147828 RepID=A0A4S2L7K5_OPIFE|nr:hypothetical protein CRM22_009445 [Opisthorchis felineus]